MIGITEQAFLKELNEQIASYRTRGEAAQHFLNSNSKSSRDYLSQISKNIKRPPIRMQGVTGRFLVVETTRRYLTLTEMEQLEREK